jgi:hypothetical protein
MAVKCRLTIAFLRDYLLLQGLPEDKKAELRATIAALEAEAATNKQKEKERTYSTKYHKVTRS